ncbi:MAG: ABC transporter ATP-binding protein [Phycisphaerae bacterium]|nr:ABC transporter ATP-binding protein [Phycisphaerae bacterium]
MQILAASQLTFSYDDRPILRGVGVTLNEGELVALFGPNGSGKSTLLKVLLGSLRAEGSLRWNGTPIASWSRRQLSRIVAYLPQNPTHQPGQTAGDVLRMGRLPYWSAFGLESPGDLQVVAEVARQLDLQAILSRPMDQISGGQRQRVFIGRCLAAQPRALLLDEPGTFLDLRHQLELFRLLRRLASESRIGVLMASHDLNLAAAYADRAIVLNEGAVAAEGPPTEALRPEVLESVYGIGITRLEIDGKFHWIPRA